MTGMTGMTARGQRFERFRRVGVIADGVFKVMLGVLFVAGAGWLGPVLEVPAWLMLLSGVVVLAAGSIEVGMVDRRSMRTYTRLMIAYDSCWVAVTVAGLLLARAGSANGGVLWIGYQAVASLVLVAVLVAARPTSATAEPTPAPLTTRIGR